MNIATRGFASLALLTSCVLATEDANSEPTVTSTALRPAGAVDLRELLRTSASRPEALVGRLFFENPLPATNGRSCASCHVLDDHTALAPEHVTTMLIERPHDPLFNPIDADDPSAAQPTYDHLAHGLVRVLITLPDNVDLIQVPPEWTLLAPAGSAQAWWDETVVPGSRLGDPLPPGKLPEIITPADRKIEVWRGVPSVENTAFGDPFQYDGRETSLAAQAQAALEAHSTFHGEAPPLVLRALAAFQESLFSSKRARTVARALSGGAPRDQVARPEDTDPAFARGREAFQTFCAPCHGKATGDRMESEELRKLFFLELDQAGNVVWQRIPVPFPPGQIAVPVNVPRPGNEFLNLGTSMLTFQAQALPEVPPSQGATMFTEGLAFPRYRLRFYTDASRSEQLTDLPPLPMPSPFSPLAPHVDPETGLIVAGPNFAPQAWTPDPGRALISGDPADFEAFNIPQLRGAANTAPYFHDNSIATLRELVDVYSFRFLPFIPPLNVHGAQPGEHALSDQERQDLLAYLEQL